MSIRNSRNLSKIIWIVLKKDTATILIANIPGVPAQKNLPTWFGSTGVRLWGRFPPTAGRVTKFILSAKSILLDRFDRTIKFWGDKAKEFEILGYHLVKHVASPGWSQRTIVSDMEGTVMFYSGTSTGSHGYYSLAFDKITSILSKYGNWRKASMPIIFSTWWSDMETLTDFDKWKKWYAI